MLNKKTMRARRIDSNQNKVVKQLRASGLSVAITSMVSNGFPDLVVSGFSTTQMCIGKRTVLIELKDLSQKPSDRKLSPAEKKFHDSWKGEIYVCTTAEDILKIFGLI